MNHAKFEATWLARAIRIFGVKELFDAGTNFASVGISFSRVGPDVSDRFPLFWAFVSLLLGLVLLRGAGALAVFCIGPLGARRVTRSLSIADSAWLSIGIRAFGVWLVVTAVGQAAEGLVQAATRTGFGYGATDKEALRYVLWSLVYGVVGALFARRPDSVGVVMMVPSGEKKT